MLDLKKKEIEEKSIAYKLFKQKQMMMLMSSEEENEMLKDGSGGKTFMQEIYKQITAMQEQIEKLENDKPVFDFNEFEGQHKEVLDEINLIYKKIELKMDTSEFNKI